MTVADAQKTLNGFGRERLNADRANMDWQPDRATRSAITEAKETIFHSVNGERKLNRAGQALYYNENF